jgi:hypothetical protein
MDEEGEQPSGSLSPRRIEAIHIAFNKVFDNARMKGIIRDPSTYRSFDRVFKIAMERQAGEEVNEEEEENDKQHPQQAEETTEVDGQPTVDSQDYKTVEIEASRNEFNASPGVKDSEKIIANSQETTKDHIMLSGDDEYLPSNRQRRVSKRKRPRALKYEEATEGTLFLLSF